MGGDGTKPKQFGLLPYPQATAWKENFPQLFDIACLPSSSPARNCRVVLLRRSAPQPADCRVW